MIPRITDVTDDRDEWRQFWDDRMDDMRRNREVTEDEYERLLELHDHCWTGDDE